MSDQVRKPLEQKLLSLGGTQGIWEGDHTHAALILAHGHDFPQHVQLRQAGTNRCHANAAVLWASDVNTFKLVTGYPLKYDRWLSHSWALAGETLCETVLESNHCFGVALPPPLALRFGYEHFYNHYYLDRKQPPYFWDEHQSILDLYSTLPRLPPNE
jgi:hypothetical protein